MHLKLYGSFGGSAGYTFAIENPKGSYFFRTDEAKQLMEPDPDMPEWRPAVECEFHFCVFNGGEYRKATKVLTNNPAIIHFLGRKDKVPHSLDDYETVGDLLEAVRVQAERDKCPKAPKAHPQGVDDWGYLELPQPAGDPDHPQVQRHLEPQRHKLRKAAGDGQGELG